MALWPGARVQASRTPVGALGGVGVALGLGAGWFGPGRTRRGAECGLIATSRPAAVTVTFPGAMGVIGGTVPVAVSVTVPLAGKCVAGMASPGHAVMDDLPPAEMPTASRASPV